MEMAILSAHAALERSFPIAHCLCRLHKNAQLGNHYLIKEFSERYPSISLKQLTHFRLSH